MKARKGLTIMLVNGTTYHDATPAKVCEILEESLKTRKRLVLVYGNVDTLEVWENATPDRGHVGRSMGPIKIPLLIRTSRSHGGEGILDRCIIEIRESRGGRVLYRRGQS